MPNGGSVNQTESSDLTTTSFGELSGLPSNLSISTVTVPSYSVRVTRLLVVLAGDEPALPVAGIAVGVVRGRTIDAGASGPLVPAHDAVVGNVAPEQAARIAEVDRPLAPAHAGGEAFDAREREAILGEARIKDVDRRIRITFARLPAPERRAGGCHCEDRACAGEPVTSGDVHGIVLSRHCPRPRAGRVDRPILAHARAPCA